MLNAKAYALSVRDDTSFRVEGGSGGSSSSGRLSIFKVTVTNIDDTYGCNFVASVIKENSDETGYSAIVQSTIPTLASSETTIEIVAVDGVGILFADNNRVFSNVSSTLTRRNAQGYPYFEVRGDGSLTVISEDNGGGGR